MRNVIQVTLVLAMLATGAAIVLAAVVKVQIAAKRLACGNQLHVLACTLETYHNSNSCYPAGTAQNTNLPPEERLSWLVTIWPYIEAGPGLRLNPSESWKLTLTIRRMWSTLARRTNPLIPLDT